MDLKRVERPPKPKPVVVGPGYELVAEQLRTSIMHGDAQPGDRLPNEVDLAQVLGTSRTTVREALRMLTAEGLITTKTGVKGGSFVAHPSTEATSERFRQGLDLLSSGLSLRDFMEIRVSLEVMACRLAAGRRTEEELVELAALAGASTPSDARNAALDRDFHSMIITMTHNPLLRVTAGPMFLVLQSRLDRRKAPKYQRTVTHHHQGIAGAIEDGDGELAAELMVQHLDWVTPLYERMWTGGRRA